MCLYYAYCGKLVCDTVYWLELKSAEYHNQYLKPQADE